MSNQVGKGKYLLSFVLLVVLTSSIYFVLNQDQVKIDIQKTYTDFFVNTNGSWDLAGREYVKIWDGTTLMRANFRELKTFVNGNESWVLRNSTFKDNIILEEWYYINGSTSDITMFPVSHNFTVYNAEGKLLMYEVQKLTYDGPTTNSSISSPQYFGKNMKVEWEGGNYYSKITNSLSNDKIQVKWRIDSDIYSKSARLFDPPSIAEYIYVGGANQSIIKYDSDFNIVAVSPNYGGFILSISIDDDYVYYGGSSTNTVRKAYKTNLSTITDSPNYGGNIYSISIDDDYVYYGGSSTNTVRKAYKNNLSTITDSPNYGGVILSISIDDDYVYYGGSSTNTVRKAYKTNLSTITDSPNYGGNIYSISIDDDYVYYGGSSTNTVRKAYKNNLSTITDSPNSGGIVRSISIDDDYVYYSGYITFADIVRKAYKTNLSTITDSPSYGGTILSISIDKKKELKEGAFWWNNDWKYKRLINLTANVGNFSYLYEVPYSENMQEDYDDLIFTNKAEDTELNFTIQSYNSTSAIVRINSLGETEIYMYYGNPLATSASSASDTHFNPIAYYYLDEASGTTAYDALGNYNGTNNGATVNVTGKINTSYSFDGSSSYVDLNLNPNTVGFTAVTMSVWVNPTANNIRNPIIQRYDGTNQWWFVLNNDGTISWYTYNGASHGISSKGTYSANQWTHLVATYNGTVYALYKNGVLVYSMTSSFVNPNANLYLGKDNIGVIFNGKIDEVGIWDKALTPEQIYQLYTYTAPTYTIGEEEIKEGVIITLNSPADELQSTSSTINFNATIAPKEVTIKNVTLYLNGEEYLDLYDTNETIDYFKTLELEDGSYTWNISACFIGESLVENCTESETRTFEIDATLPNITVTSGNGSYLYNETTNVHRLNFTISDENLNQCLFEYNGTNQSLYCAGTNSLLNDTAITFEGATSTKYKEIYFPEGLKSLRLINATVQLRTSSASYSKEQTMKIKYKDGTEQTYTSTTTSTSFVTFTITNSNYSKEVEKVEFWAREVSTSGSGYMGDAIINFNNTEGDLEYSIVVNLTNETTQARVYADDLVENIASETFMWSYLLTEFKDIGKYFNSNNLEIDIYQEKYGYDSPINVSLLINGNNMGNYTMENNSENISFEIYLDDGTYNQSLELCMENGCIYSNNYTFYVDTINPIVNIIYPILNGTYYFDLIYGPNYTYEDASPGYCYYTVDEESSDEIDAGLNFSGLLYGKGDLTITCTDYAGNEITTNPIYIDAPSYLEIKNNASATLCGDYEYGVINITNSTINLCTYNGTNGTGGANLIASRYLISDSLTFFNGTGKGYQPNTTCGVNNSGVAGFGDGAGGAGANSTNFFGAGGAGHASNGGAGAFDTGQTSANGGSSYGDTTDFTAEMGSSGGTSGGVNTYCATGGAGGGYLKAYAPEIKFNSKVNLDGINGTKAPANANTGAGGGGSGGSLLIIGRNVNVSLLNVSNIGGAGGNLNTASTTYAQCGGGGASGGRVGILYTRLENTSVNYNVNGSIGGTSSAACEGGASVAGGVGDFQYFLYNNLSVVNISSPANNSKLTDEKITFIYNATDPEGDITSTYLYLNDVLIDQRDSEPTTEIYRNFSIKLSPGNYNVTVIAEEFGIFSDPVIHYFSVDYMPNISIISPSNGFSTYDDIKYIYYTYYPFYNGSCWYSQGATNSTKVSGDTGVFEINSTIGENDITIYCNNSFGNLSSVNLEYTLEKFRYNETTDNESYYANFSEKNNIFVKLDINPVFYENRSYVSEIISTPWSYTNWNTNEPNGAAEDCLQLTTGGKWNDLSCTSTTLYALCSFNNGTYHKSASTMNWANAKTYCEGLDGNLAVIPNATVNAAAYAVGGTNSWLGGFQQSSVVEPPYNLGWEWLPTIIYEVSPLFNNITFNLYNNSGIINSTTFSDSTNEFNFTDLTEGVYFYNASICDTDGICEDLKERIYAKQELTLTANNGTDPLYLELGSKFLVNATENTGLAYLDLLDDGVLIYRDEINYNSTFLYNITEFVKKRFANGETEMNLTFSTDENKTIEIMAHQYDEVFYIEFNVLGEEINNSYPENFIIYSTNNSILKYFNGVLIGDRVYINKSISLTNEEKGEDSLSFYSKGRNYVDFLMDSNNVINDFEFYVRGLTGGLDYSTHFNINNSEIDYSKSTGMVRLGYLLPAGKDLKEFVYDTFTGTSINYTKWSFAQSGVITDYHGIPEYEYTMSPKIQGNQLRMDFTYREDIPSPSTRGGADFEFDSIMNISLFNLLTTESFSLDFSFDAKVDNDCDGAGDCRDGSEYFRILAGDAVLYTTKRDYCDADTGSSCWTQTKSLEPIKINITRLNHSAVLLQLQGTQYSYSTDYHDNDCGWVKKTYNYTNSSLREQYQYGGKSGCTGKPKDRTSYLANEYVVAIPAGSGDKPIRASAYLAVDYDLEDGTGTYDGDGWYTVDNVYHTIYNQSSAEIISKKIVEASSNIGQVTVDVGGSVISADYTGTPYEDFETLLYISTDGGINYEPVINFGSPTVLTNPGTELVFKEIIDMNGKSGYATAIPLAVNLFDFYNPPSYPSNVSFDFGGDGIIDYSLSEELNESHGEVKISLTNISTLNHLNRSWEGIGDTLRVPLYVYSDTAGTVELFNYNLSYNPNPIHFEGETFYDEVNSFNGLSNLSIPFRASIGNILVDTLTYSYAGGDKNYTLLLHSPDYATNQSINISLIYSKWDYEFNPFNVEYILFSPRTAVSKNVEPYGQSYVKSIPLLNITNYGYGSILGKNQTDLYVYINSSLACVNTTISVTNNKSKGTLLTQDWNKIAENISYLDNVPIYLWADYSCDYSNYYLYNPYLYFAQEINGTISDKNL